MKKLITRAVPKALLDNSTQRLERKIVGLQQRINNLQHEVKLLTPTAFAVDTLNCVRVILTELRELRETVREKQE